MLYTLLFIILAISACTPMPEVVEPLAGKAKEENEYIYVVSHGWHTGLVVPATLIQSHIPQLKRRLKDIPYIEFGWGDEGFYQSKEISIGLTIKALFWPTESVVHAVAVPELPNDYFSNSTVEKICLKRSEYISLIRFIENSLLKNDHGEIIALKTGIYGDSQFYQSIGDFHLLNTCNKWTAKGLKSGGLDINPTFKLTAASIMDYLADNRRVFEHERCSLLP